MWLLKEIGSGSFLGAGLSRCVLFQKDGMDFIPEKYKGGRANERGTGGYKRFNQKACLIACMRTLPTRKCISEPGD